MTGQEWICYDIIYNVHLRLERSMDCTFQPPWTNLYNNNHYVTVKERNFFVTQVVFSFYMYMYVLWLFQPFLSTYPNQEHMYIYSCPNLSHLRILQVNRGILWTGWNRPNPVQDISLTCTCIHTTYMIVDRFVCNEHVHVRVEHLFVKET